MLEKIFKLQSNNTSLGKEVLAGITTFVTMAYIIFVNPQMMSVSGMDLGASFVGTCLALVRLAQVGDLIVAVRQAARDAEDRVSASMAWRS